MKILVRQRLDSIVRFRFYSSSKGSTKNVNGMFSIFLSLYSEYYLLWKLPWYIETLAPRKKNCQSIDVNKELTCCEIDEWVIGKILFEAKFN